MLFDMMNGPAVTVDGVMCYPDFSYNAPGRHDLDIKEWVIIRGSSTGGSQAITGTDDQYE